MREHGKAIADCTEAIRLNPTYAAAYYNPGAAYTNKSKYDEAIADFTEAIRLRPQDTIFYSSRATVYRALGEDAKATRDERTAQQLRK